MTLTSLNIKPFQLKLNRCGDVELSSTWGRDKAYIDHSRFYYVLEGGGYVKTETETVLLEPGNMYLIPSHFHHSYGCTKMRKLYFMFSLTSTTNTDALSGLNTVLRAPFDPEDVQTLLETWQKTDCLSVMTVRALLMKHICQLLKDNGATAVSLDKYSPLVENARSYIRTDATAAMTVGTVSAHLFVSESKLRNAFLKETGTTVGQYIDEQIHLRAKLLLQKPQLSIGEISTQLGFCDQFYFSRKFKATEGMTPSAYRQNLRK